MPRKRWHSLIWKLADARGWNDAELARQIGVNHSTLTRWRRGAMVPSTERQQQCAEVFGLPRDVLFWEEVEPLLAEAVG